MGGANQHQFSHWDSNMTGDTDISPVIFQFDPDFDCVCNGSRIRAESMLLPSSERNKSTSIFSLRPKYDWWYGHLTNHNSFWPLMRPLTWVCQVIWACYLSHFIRTLNMTGDMDISPDILQFDPGCEGLPWSATLYHALWLEWERWLRGIVAPTAVSAGG